VVSLTDLHVEDGLFCRAQDLLLLYEESPALVRREELAEVVRGLLSRPHWSCADDLSIIPTRSTSARSNLTRGRTARRIGR
jgi:hypothetical protein